jgi:hypothetical protein
MPTIRTSKPLRWFHTYSQFRILLEKAKPIKSKKKKSIFIKSTEQRRYEQRSQMVLQISSYLRKPDQQEEYFWRAMRWGGVGFLTAQTLHYFLTR